MSVFRAGLATAMAFAFLAVLFSTAHAANITVNDDTTYKSVDAIGYYEAGAADATGHSVTVTAGGVVGNTMDNINGGRSVFGAQSDGTGQVYGNTATMTGGRVFASMGGAMGGNVIGGATTPGGMARGVVRNNSVFISGGIVDDSAFGGYAEENDARENRVEISGNAVIGNTIHSTVGDVFGGYSDGGSALRNIAVIRGGAIAGGVVGGLAEDSNPADVAEYNEVYVSGGTIREGVAGGSSYGGRVAYNYVEITGGSIYDAIVGGYSDQADAIHNTVRIGAATLDAGIDIYGGVTGGLGDVLTGNTLYLDGFTGTVREINNFEKYHFHLPASLANGGTLVSTTGTATDLSASTVEGISIAAASPLTTSHTVVLLDNVTGAFTQTTLQAAKGTSLLLDVMVEVDGGGRLTATFGTAYGQSVNPQGKALSQSRIGGMSLLGQGADLVADTIFDSALAGAALAGSPSGATAFASSSVSRYRVKTGSHVDSDGWSLLAGLAWNRQGPERSGWLAGAFFETGRGSYDGYNAFSTANVHSSGDLTYYGGGVMGQYRLINGLRAEGSFRVGRLETDYRASGFAVGTPRYDLDSTYLGSHFGLGYDRDFTDRLRLDLSAKYLWTRQAGKSVNILGERHRFDSADSHRVRAGGRVAYAGCVVSPYAGAYFEYEFDGKARTHNRTTGIRYASPNTRGATYVGELGVKFTPTRSLDIDLSVQGHTGRRDGVQGRLSAAFSF